MRKLALVLLLIAAPAFAALHFPALTGRVVDAAHILSPATQASLERSLADYEQGSGNQMVVATIPSLEGDAIEDYGYQLGRYWGIGQKGKDNGVLLVVAPKEREVRIEVGYGLEGVLTDAVSSAIIHGVILPDFKAGDMEKGVADGTAAILTALGGGSVHAPAPAAPAHAPSLLGSILFIVVALWFIGFAIRHPVLAMLMLSSSRFGSGGGNFGGGGFSGGGGSFGGGGASGSW